MAKKFWDKLLWREKKRVCVSPFVAYLICGVGIVSLALAMTVVSLDKQPAPSKNLAGQPPSNEAPTVISTTDFGVISDTHIQQRNSNIYSYIPENNFKEVAKQLNALQLAFVVNTGDNVDDLYCNWTVGCIVAPGIMNAYRDLIKNNFKAGRPYVVAMGNHDDRYFFYDLLWQKSYFKIVRNTAKNEWSGVLTNQNDTTFFVMPGGNNKPVTANYSFSMDSYFEMVVLDSTGDSPAGGDESDTTNDWNDATHFGATQIAWLDSTLARITNSGRHAILFWHGTPFGDLASSACSCDAATGTLSSSCNVDYLKTINKYKDTVTAVFTGHAHSYQKQTWCGRTTFYQTTTSTCYASPTVNYCGASAYLWPFFIDSQINLGMVNGANLLPDFPLYYHVKAEVFSDRTVKVSIANEQDIFGSDLQSLPPGCGDVPGSRDWLNANQVMDPKKDNNQQVFKLDWSQTFSKAADLCKMRTNNPDPIAQ